MDQTPTPLLALEERGLKRETRVYSREVKALSSIFRTQSFAHEYYLRNDREYLDSLSIAKFACFTFLSFYVSPFDIFLDIRFANFSTKFYVRSCASLE